MAFAKAVYQNQSGPWIDGWAYSITKDGFPFLTQPHSPNNMQAKINTQQIAGLLADLIIEKQEGILPEKETPAFAIIYTDEEFAINDHPGTVNLHQMALDAWDKENPAP